MPSAGLAAHGKALEATPNHLRWRQSVYECRVRACVQL